MVVALIIHGGAGEWSKEDYEKSMLFLKSIAKEGISMLRRGDSSLDVVEYLISLMEDSMIFNAGLGAVTQADGEARMDASIMTSDLRAGAVASVRRIKNPIKLARRVLEWGRHVLLVGEGAELFAWSLGFKPYLVRNEERIKKWMKNQAKYFGKTYGELIISSKEGDTVGAVAIDKGGTITAGTSTGGIVLSYPGRVGDTPLIGAGTYANAFAGASATGIGEYIIKICMSKSVVDKVKNGEEVTKASISVVKELEEIGGRGGIITLDKDGNCGFHYNTSYMPTVCEKYL
jgi:beta-aspartyl-peptidase (threonine type)